ncbi:glycosyltransferase family 4 protein [Oscillatoriales cyanobacterium LEGE 11467]|uniref:Glycosyltransferase family 4 protein n=1 Tax=Zarconia navalis LEGE 11467 TaxID=1828826 RepID=A0A928VYL6_9CYAN|nr:glycosyltransferase family 4 protein [Zarconia navalis]MBE9041207.1 glycosyltransferase family 4 protein [Zarconia navalis LEGE 11467]
MKLIYVSHVHPPSDAKLEQIGGMQTVSIELLKRLQNCSQVSVFPLLLESPAKGIEFRVAKFMGWLSLNLPRIVAREKADLILFSSMVTGSLTILLRNKIQIPMVAINHGQDTVVPIFPYQQILPKIFDCLNGVISVSEATKKSSIQRGLKPENGFVLPNGIKIEARSYDKQNSREILEKSFDLNLKYRYLLLSVGRQVKRKGHAWFIEKVFSLLDRNCTFLAIGDGKEHATLQELKRRSSVGDRIILPGRVSPELLRHAYDASDVFVMPNIPVAGDMEGFGVVMLEANEARTPVVASDLEGIQDVVCNGKNGYRVRPYDDRQFAQIVRDILNSKLEDLSESAYQFAAENFAWQNLGNRYIRCLQEIVNRAN